MMMRYAIAAAMVVTTVPVSEAHAATLVVDVAGAEGYSTFGSFQNTTQTFNIGALSRVTSLAYDVTLTAFSPSYLSEAGVAFTGSNLFEAGVSFMPGVEDENPGASRYVGTVDLVAAGLGFAVGTDGLLRLEYFDTFNDQGVAPDSSWTGGTLTFTYDEVAAAVPETSTWIMMLAGFGMIGLAARKRSSAKTTVNFV